MSQAVTAANINAVLHIPDSGNAIGFFRAKDPVSSMTHFIACIAAILFTPVMLIHAADCGKGFGELCSLAVFMLSMIMLYGASASYHGFRLEGQTDMWLKRLDHMMIFVLIAGSYTPICVMVLGHDGGYILLTAVWSVAFIGMIFKMLWVTCPKWISSVIYISMGWMVIPMLPRLLAAAGTAPVAWLFAGGVIYTIGGVIYALKLISFNSRGSLWGSHEIFHLFVMAGTICQFISIYMMI